MTCRPSMPGSRRSEMTTSKAKWLSSSSAFSPDLGLGHLESVLDEALRDHRPERRFVVYQEQMY